MTEALLAGAGLLLLVIAGLLAFLPLPLNAVGTCGPDFRSSSALTVVRDPDVVNVGASPRVPEYVKQQLRQLCLAQARQQVGTAGVLLVAGVLLGVGGPTLVELVWRNGTQTDAWLGMPPPGRWGTAAAVTNYSGPSPGSSW